MANFIQNQKRAGMDQERMKWQTLFETLWQKYWPDGAPDGILYFKSTGARSSSG
jgi:hypothetical protein